MASSKIVKELQEEYFGLLHAVQSGVAADPAHDSLAPKHLRTGLNGVLCDHGALVDLLIRKGLITEQEYWEASVKMLKTEVARYEEELSEKFGKPVTLG